MATSGTNWIKETNVASQKVIKFYFKTDDIFNEASEITSFKASSIKDGEGLSSFNSVAISEDERVHLKKHTKKGVLEIFSVMFKILDPSNTSVFYDSDITVGAATFNAYGASILDNENRYRDINLELISSKISDAIIDFVLERWYWLKNKPEDAAAHQLRYKTLINQINDLSLNLRLQKNA